MRLPESVGAAPRASELRCNCPAPPCGRPSRAIVASELRCNCPVLPPPRPFVAVAFSWTKGGVKVFSVPLRGPPWTRRCCRCRSPCPSAALRGQKKVLPLPFSVPLRGPPWTKKKVLPLPFVRVLPWPFRGQKKVLPLPFSAPLRGPPWTKGVAVAVLRAPPSVDKRCCRCRSPRPCCRCRSWPFVDKRWLPLRCSPCPSAALRGQKVLPLPFSAPPPSSAILASELRCVCPDLHPHSTGKISPHVRQFTPV